MQKKLTQHINSNPRLKLARSLNQRGKNLIKNVGVPSMRFKYVKS